MNSDYRIKKNSEFADVIDKKQIVKDQNIIIYFKQNDYNHLRFGLSVSKKVGIAVVRNKVKRQIRSFILNNKDLQTKNIDIVIVVKPEFIKNTYQENLKNFLKLVKSIL